MGQVLSLQSSLSYRRLLTTVSLLEVGRLDQLSMRHTAPKQDTTAV